MKFLLALLLASVVSASAHPFIQDAMWVVFAPDRVRVAANVSVREIYEAQQANEATLDAASQKHGNYVLQHLTLKVGDKRLAGRVQNITPPILFGDPEQTFYQFEIDYPLPPGPPPDRVTFQHAMLSEFSYSPGQPWDVTYIMRLKRSDQPEVNTALLRVHTPQEFATGWSTPAVAQVQSASTFGAYLHHGVMHILAGWDHLLFIAALVLATASFWEMFKVIAAFTLAHTITLAISVLTGFRMPTFVVEPIIAGSIVFVALQNILWPRRGYGWWQLGIAFAFGLVHGLGFAGGLRTAMGELGTTAVVLALIAFSLGVEIGHQVIVLPFFGVLRLGTSKFSEAFRVNALRFGSILISIGGAYYLVHALRVA